VLTITTNGALAKTSKQSK